MKIYDLRQLLTIRNGKDHKSIMNGNIPIFGSGGIMRFGNQYLYDKPSILLPRKGSLHNIQFSKAPFWTVDTLYYTEINDQLAEPYFLYNYLKILDLGNLNTGTGVPSMTFDSYYNLKIALPEKSIQKKIANILSDIDIKIDLNNQINDNLECMAKSLYDYWFVQFDFPDENGKPYKSSGGKMIWNDVLKREIPEGWESKKIGDLFNISNETINPLNFPKKVFKHYSIPKWDSSNTYGKELGSTINSNKFLVKNGDVLISKLNPWFNRAIYNTDENDMVCSTEFVILETSSNEEKAFLFQLAKSDKFINYCILNAVGTSNSHKRVNPQTLIQYTIPFHKNILISFGNKIFSLLEKSKSNQQQNQQLSFFRDWLLPMLMNGQVKVE